MSDETVYVAAFEVGFEPGCAMHGEGKGAFVWCFVKSPSEADAEARVRSALAADAYSIKTLEWVEAASDLDWESEAAEMDALVAEADRTGDVVYSTFNLYVDD
jgi:hypothetical protein